MNANDKDRIIQRYNQRLDLYGYDIRTLASGTEERRLVRFQVLRDVGIALHPECTVLDVGCGFGDFYSFLRKESLPVRYTGYDINPRLIEVARQKYPEAAFEVRDILTEEFDTFDFIVSSSTFNLALDHEDNYQHMAGVLKTSYSHSTQGVAVDFLSSYVDFKTPEAFHYEPERIFSIAKSITKRVCLRHDYPLFEFCVYLYKDFQGWR
jgi:SAM-dependent methyltransferase